MMSMDSSPVVCQVPDCATTQAEIEAELRTFLAGFCSICKKDRGGKLCGCAFPCSLTFRAQMLTKIHELLGVEKPPQRRAIQVCFKHPDLLRNAREACVAKREDHMRTSGGFTGGFGGASVVNSPLSATGRRRGRPRKVVPIAVTSSYPVTLTSRQTESESKMTNIQFGSTLNIGNQSIVVGGEDRLAEAEDDEGAVEEHEYGDISQVTNHEDTRGSAPLAEEMRKHQEVKMTKLKFTIGGGSDEDELDETSDEEQGSSKTPGAGENGFKRNQKSPATKLKKSAFYRIESDSSDQDSFDEDEAEQEEEDSDVQFICNQPPKQHREQKSKKILKVQYENYGQSVLQQEMGSLLCQGFLNDVTLVCKNGYSITANSLLLGSMSPFLRRLLSEAPVVDSNKVVILPDIHLASMELFLGLVFNEQCAKSLDRRKIMRVRQVARLLNIRLLLRSVKEESAKKHISPRKPPSLVMDALAETKMSKIKVNASPSPKSVPVQQSSVTLAESAETSAVATEGPSSPSRNFHKRSPEKPIPEVVELVDDKSEPLQPSSPSKRKKANENVAAILEENEDDENTSLAIAKKLRSRRKLILGDAMVSPALSELAETAGCNIEDHSEKKESIDAEASSSPQGSGKGNTCAGASNEESTAEGPTVKNSKRTTMSLLEESEEENGGSVKRRCRTRAHDKFAADGTSDMRSSTKDDSVVMACGEHSNEPDSDKLKISDHSNIGELPLAECDDPSLETESEMPCVAATTRDVTSVEEALPDESSLKRCRVNVKRLKTADFNVPGPMSNTAAAEVEQVSIPELPKIEGESSAIVAVSRKSRKSFDKS